jgi:uncharacterized membrane protein
MKRRTLMQLVDSEYVKTSIQAAETRTSGEIRVSVSPFFWGNVDKVAHRAFTRLGMASTRERNGILFFVVPSRRKFAVIGDLGIHEQVGQEFWNRLAETLSTRFRAGKFTEGLVEAIAECGEQLAAHFPYDRKTDVNELPDEIDFGKG